MSFLKTASSSLRQKPSSRERLIFFGALFAVGFLFVRTGVLEPLKVKDKLHESLVQIEQEKEELEKRAAITAGKPVKEAEDKESRQELAWIGNKKFLDLATDALVLAAKRNNISLLRFNFSPAAQDEGVTHKPISLTLTGTLANLGRYLEATEHLAIPLVVKRLSLEPSSDFASVVTLRVEGGFYANM